MFIVIAKQIIKENCLHYNFTKSLLSDGVITIIGMYTLSPTSLLHATLTSKICFPHSVMTNHVLLHRPNDWSIFLSSITRTPFFKHNMWFSKLEIPLRNIGIHVSLLSSLVQYCLYMVLDLRYILCSPNSNDKT